MKVYVCLIVIKLILLILTLIIYFFNNAIFENQNYNNNYICSDFLKIKHFSSCEQIRFEDILNKISIICANVFFKLNRSVGANINEVAYKCRSEKSLGEIMLTGHELNYNQI